MNNILAYINRRVKNQEKHLDIKLNFKDEEIDTTFSRFSSFSSNGADIELVSSNKEFVLHYNFNTGTLTEIKEGTDIDVNEVGYLQRDSDQNLQISH